MATATKSRIKEQRDQGVYDCHFCKRAVRGYEMEPHIVHEMAGNYFVHFECPYCGCTMGGEGGLWREDF